MTASTLATGASGDGQGTATPLQDARKLITSFVERDDLTDDQVTEWIEFSEELKESLKDRLPVSRRVARTIGNPWVVFGLFAQAAFMMRFVIQIIASERRKQSYVPVAFWYLSLIGGLMLLAYALQRRDPVFVFGQSLGCGIYVRNLVLISRRRKQAGGLNPESPAPVAES